MSTLLYAVPDEQYIQVISPDHVKDLVASSGLQDQLGVANPEANGCSVGPNGGPMAVLSAKPVASLGGTCSAPKYQPEEQTWLDCGGFWLGKWNASDDARRTSPVPADLVRERSYGTYVVKLADNQWWAVPVIPAQLPRRLVMTKEGPQLVVDPSMQWLVDLGQKWQDINSGLKPRPNDLEMARDAVAVIGLNYRVSLWEASFLGLINTDAMAVIIGNCILDLKATEEQDAAEKNAQ